MSAAAFEDIYSSNPFTFIYLEENFYSFLQLTEQKRDLWDIS